MPNAPLKEDNASVSFTNVACPFCGLVCNDLSINSQAGHLSLTENGCDKAKKQFERPPVDDSPRVNGKAVSYEVAIKAAASLIRKSRMPLYAGLGTDVSGMRGIMELTDRSGGVVDHMLGDGLSRNYLVLQDRGWMTTTMTEIRNRADLIIFAGTDATSHPLLFDKTIWNKESMFDLETSQRDIVFIGNGLKTRAGISPSGKKPVRINCETARIGEVMSVLRMLVTDKPVHSQTVAGAKLKALEKLAAQMKAAKYGVIIWSPGSLNFPHADLAIQSITELVKQLNLTTRFNGFPLGGDEGGLSAANVCAWQSGYPLRTGFGKGHSRYEPTQYSTQALLESGQSDLLFWTSSVSTGHPPPETELATIVLAEPGIKLKNSPEVFIPVGTAGIDHKGQMIRCDVVVSLRLRKLRNSNLPSVQKVTQDILQSL